MMLTGKSLRWGDGNPEGYPRYNDITVQQDNARAKIGRWDQPLTKDKEDSINHCPTRQCGIG